MVNSKKYYEKESWIEMKLLRDVFNSSIAILFFFVIGMIIYVLTLLVVDSARLYYDGLIAVFAIISICYVGISILYKYAENKVSHFPRQSLFTAAFAAAMLVYSFHITLPTIIDRSISLFVLSRMEGGSAGVPVEDLQASFIKGYVHNYSAICRRLDEQLISGNVVFQNNKYYLTKNGEDILKVLRWIARLVKRNEYYITDSSSEKLLYTYTVVNGQCVYK